MSSFFDDLWSAAQPAFDGPLGETVRITPEVTKARGSKYVAGVADPAIPPFDAVGIFRSAVVATRVMGSGANTRENADLLEGKTTVDFDVAQFTAERPAPVEGWFVTLTSRADAPVSGTNGVPVGTTQAANSNTPTFNAAGGDWGTIISCTVFDAATGGNEVFYSSMTTSRTVKDGDAIAFPAGQITLSQD